MSVQLLLKRWVPEGWRRGVREGVLPFFVKHIRGPKWCRLESNEAAVTCLVRNGEFYLRSFIEHYTEMGFRHLFLLDNGSDDKTVEIAAAFENVTIYRCTLPVETYQASFKRHLAERTVRGGWCLDVDIDEFFDYPYSECFKVQRILEYLNSKGYTAVVTQMLDLFAEKPWSQLEHKREEDVKEVYGYYDLSEVRKEGYRASKLAALYGNQNRIGYESTALCFGGIRKTLYGIDPLLTKHSLFRPGRGLELFPHVHFVNRARLADISCLLRHYKLTSNAQETSRQNRAAFPSNGKGYGDLLSLVASQSDFQIKRATATKFGRAEELIDSGFLFMSDDYRAFTKKNAGAGSGARAVAGKAGPSLGLATSGESL